MSRSSLQRQEQMRLRAQQQAYLVSAAQASGLLPSASDGSLVGDGVGVGGEKRHEVPMYGNLTSYNINPLLHRNIIESDYYRALSSLTTYHELLHEAQRVVTHVEPWQSSSAKLPSSAFCILLKLMEHRLTMKQLNGILSYRTSPYVRALGILFLRYTCPPNDLWTWFQPYMEDQESFIPTIQASTVLGVTSTTSKSGYKTEEITIGEYIHRLLTDMQYYGTVLPRIPVPIERRLKIELLLLSECQKRRKKNWPVWSQGLLFVGSISGLRAIYGDEENEPAWYDAIIDEIDTSVDWTVSFHVTFPEYGNKEWVDLGELDVSNVPGAKEILDMETRKSNIDRRSDNRRSSSRERRGHSPRRQRRDSRDTRNYRSSRYDSRGRGGRSRSRSRDRQ